MDQPHANSSFAKQVIAADERYHVDSARIDRIRAFRERNAESAWRASALVTERHALGLGLIRAGEQVRGAAVPSQSLERAGGRRFDLT